ncbi:hypothetical protein Zmor_016971 [Zophobas morio]|uniref:Protein takeout n=2 Tax=Zophobas morio TaxID=2755281 RepID=A0AA38I8M3_9CUCU|nr:hypothetical protein Zmor_016971 [Zophobas morio]
MFRFCTTQSLVFVFACIALSEPKIPPNFKRCYRKDPDFRKCMFAAVQLAAPQLTKPYRAIAVPNLEPVEVSSLQVKGGGGVVAVNQNLKNCKLYGLTKSEIYQADFNLENKTWGFDFLIPELDCRCDYQLDGKVLLLPIKGEGNCTIVFDKMHVKLKIDFEEVVKDSRTHFKVSHSQIENDVGLVTMHFDNLFNGDKALGDNINKVLNENWKEVYAEVQADYQDLLTGVMMQLLNRFFDKVSLEELFDEN